MHPHFRVDVVPVCCVVVVCDLQALRAVGEGADSSNPNLWIRQRYGKLYENFRPDVTWWRLLLIFRKFLLAWATIMFNGNAMFQVIHPPDESHISGWVVADESHLSGWVVAGCDAGVMRAPPQSHASMLCCF
jgi:hypothetical protein